jgi:putative ABC transport system permease protein
MWFALRHVSAARVRFILLAGLVALVGALVLILTGLGRGLGDASTSGVTRLPVDAVAEQDGVRLSLGRSTLTLDQVDQIGQVDGVTSAEPLGIFTVSARKTAGGSATVTAPGDAEDLALTGVEPGSPLLPEGSPALTPDGVVVDSSLEDSGYAVGDALHLEPSRRVVTISGFVNAGTYSHLPVAYVPLKTWQAVRYGPVDGVGDVPASAFDNVSAAGLTLADGVTAAQVDAASTLDGVTIVSLDQAAAATPGYKEETGTVNLMVFFLYVIGALLVGTFFWNATVQRTGEFALLRAIGASQGRLLRAHLAEVLIVAATGLLAAVIGSVGLAALLPSGVPFLLTTSALVSTVLVLLLLALLGGAASLRRVTRADPMLALGRNA